jgi:6-phosphogluconolactonase
MNLIEYPDREMMMIDVADLLAGEINSALTHEDAVTIAVPGGTTPAPIFDALCGVDLDWARVRVLPTDERWVAETDARSNARLIRTHLITERAAGARYVSLHADAPSPGEGLAEVTRQVSDVLPLTVVLLGMGADGHVASLFPGGDRLEEALADGAPSVLPMRAPGAPEARMTLTLPVLRDAMSVHIIITGDEKRETLLRARHSSASEYPVAALLGTATVHWAE